MNFSDELEYWMTNLPDSIRERYSIINLAIPGSHDSFTYGINRKSKLSPDAEEVLFKVYPFAPCVIKRWSITQKYNIREQLNCGIRYFDCRVAVRSADEDFYFVHGLFAEKIKEPLFALNEFLDDHPKEFVILDFQHFYDVSSEKHHQLIANIKNIFNMKIFERKEEGFNFLTLNNAFVQKKQLIIIYRNDYYSPEEFFPSYSFPTPWPQATNIPRLKKYLEKSLARRTQYQGFVTQCLLTPDVRFILPRFYSTLRKKCAKKVDLEMISWIKEQTPGKFTEDKPKSNVFLADFVDIKQNNFCKTVVDLNMKLLTTNAEN